MATRKLVAGQGYNTLDGRFVEAPSVLAFASQDFAAGVTIGDWIDLGHHRNVNLRCAVTAKSGTSPTLDVTLQTSPDRVTRRTVAAFAQKSDTTTKMGAVTSSGTTPPVVTLTGTPDRVIPNLKVICSTLGARGTSKVDVSFDGGVTYETTATLTAATVAVLDRDGVDTGLVLNFAAGTAAVDNVWTASCAGTEDKSFAGCDRFVRVVALVGGSATPVMTASVVGEAA